MRRVGRIDSLLDGLCPRLGSRRLSLAVEVATPGPCLVGAHLDARLALHELRQEAARRGVGHLLLQKHHVKGAAALIRLVHDLVDRADQIGLLDAHVAHRLGRHAQNRGCVERARREDVVRLRERLGDVISQLLDGARVARLGHLLVGELLRRHPRHPRAEQRVRRGRIDRGHERRRVHRGRVGRRLREGAHDGGAHVVGGRLDRKRRVGG